MLSDCHGVQRIIKELAKVASAQVVPVNEFLSSKKCATCRNVGHDKTDYLHVCSKTRQVTCGRCGVAAEPPTAASGDGGDGHEDDGDDEGYEDEATAAAAVDMDRP